jgi:hypothetical protein
MAHDARWMPVRSPLVGRRPDCVCVCESFFFVVDSQNPNISDRSESAERASRRHGPKRESSLDRNDVINQDSIFRSLVIDENFTHMALHYVTIRQIEWVRCLCLKVSPWRRRQMFGSSISTSMKRM